MGDHFAVRPRDFYGRLDLNAVPHGAGQPTPVHWQKVHSLAVGGKAFALNSDKAPSSTKNSRVSVLSPVVIFAETGGWPYQVRTISIACPVSRGLQAV